MTTDGQEPKPTSPPEGAEPKPTSLQTFDLAYVKELRQEAAGYRTKLKSLEATHSANTEKELAEQNKWKELAEKRAAELEAFKPTQDAYEKVLENLRASNEKRIEAIPEQSRSLVPDYDDPSKLALWLDANIALLTKPVAPNLNSGAGSGQRPGANGILLSDAELKMAKSLGLTPEQYLDGKKKIKQ